MKNGISKNGVEYEINPSYAPMVLNQEVGEAILSLLSEVIEDENPSLYNLCFQFLNFYLYLIYPNTLMNLNIEQLLEQFIII